MEETTLEKKYDFEIEEVEDVEAMSTASNWFFGGLAAGVVIGIAAD
ncbi:hypothetical protein [Clostridium hydrogenum]|nr:hypothetical protein [Clostridium hydrogenum]